MHSIRKLSDCCLGYPIVSLISKPASEFYFGDILDLMNPLICQI